ALQSFWPLSATPKHFSLPAAVAAFISAFDIGAAAASEARAVATAPASTAALAIDLVDILVSSVLRCGASFLDRATVEFGRGPQCVTQPRSHRFVIACGNGCPSTAFGGPSSPQGFDKFYAAA